MPRITLPTLLVLRSLLNASSDMYGLELCRATGLPSGTIHPMLARCEESGWLASRWEDIDPHEAGRRPRRYYRLTELGTQYARTAIARSVALRGLQP